MPGSSPRLLDDSLKSDIANIIVNDLVTSAVDEIDELKDLAGRLSFSRKEEQTISKPLQNLFEQLDDTYEDLLSIEKVDLIFCAVTNVSGVKFLKEILIAADTPRKEPPPQPSTEDAKESRLAELNQVLQSDKWVKAKVNQFIFMVTFTSY
ncbi:unnamed protein product [Cylicostephanus goldi]|uniref:Uncharacterized protein n=1 Tax=Cylicostephanus goldi TaxID=71465 RepID=A0A3P7NHF9_CYLGO|nr:unnamed protein product [Cylicostephanus goldi]